MLDTIYVVGLPVLDHPMHEDIPVSRKLVSGIDQMRHVGMLFRCTITARSQRMFQSDPHKAIKHTRKISNVVCLATRYTFARSVAEQKKKPEDAIFG